MLVPSLEYAQSSFRCERSRQYNIPIILTDYVVQCLKEKKLLSKDLYLVNSHSNNEDKNGLEDLKTGKISSSILLCFDFVGFSEKAKQFMIFQLIKYYKALYKLKPAYKIHFKVIGNKNP